MKRGTTEEKLVDHSEKIYKAIFDNSIDAILISTPDGGIQSANVAACKMLGFTEKEIIMSGRNGILDLTDDRLDKLLTERDQTGKVSGELRFKRKDGSVFPADFTSTIFCDAAGKDRTVTMFRDITERKITEGKLEGSEAEYRSLFENSLMAISQLIPGTGFIKINEAYAKLYGYPNIETALRDMTENTIKLYSDSADRKKVIEILDKNGYMPPTEFQLNRMNGEKFWALVSARQVRDNTGKLLYLQAEHIDITDRKKVEMDLSRSENMFRAMAENSLTGIYIFGDNKLIYVNKSLADIFGYTIDDLTGINPMKLIHPDSRSNVMESIRLRVSGEVYSMKYEFKGLKKNGETIHILVMGETVELNGERRIFGNILDLTDRKLAEENLKQSEEKYRLLSEQSGVGVGLYTEAGFILYYNNKALKNLGGKLEDYVGKSLKDVFGKKDGNKYLKRVREEIRLRKNLVYEDFFSSPTGDYWFSSRHSVFINAGGEVIGVQVVSQDISERKHFEEQLIKSSSELRELSRHLVEVREEERTSIARDLHDDLGQKLTALNMDITWLKNRIGVQSRTVENKFHQMTSLMNETIESIQKISFGLRPSILDDLGLLPALEWLIREFTKTSGIRCNISFSPEDLEVDSQISLIVFRIVQEALTNVARHSKATKVFLLVKKLEDVLEVSLKDNGKGIEKSKIEDPKSFGLIGIRERVNLVGGEIVISGRLGEGTVIQVKIPFNVILPESL